MAAKGSIAVRPVWFTTSAANDRAVPAGQLPHPFTKHSSLKKPLEVSFLQSHEVKLNGVSYKSDPHYTFTNSEDCNRFQSSFRGKELLHIFEVDKIAFKSSSSSGEASDQHLKMWNHHNGRSLAFYTNMAKHPSHVELALECFEQQAEVRKEMAVRLKLQLQGKPSTLSRRLSKTSSSTSTDDVDTVSGSPRSLWSSSMPSPRRPPSLTSVGSINSIAEERVGSAEDHLNKMRYWDITFSGIEGQPSS